MRRMEVVVRAKDAVLVKSIAAALRADGAKAAELRAKLRLDQDVVRPKTGADLLAILRAGTLFDDQTTFPRVRSARPPVSFM